ncbi:uncharacterized protein LOC121585630 [Coregonus clupeaformis]|uniref:uncharacterized protein LOC121585630 n=1 Tax=Coregonus clupeaformis TaxID=59861 RepID=UPI001BE02ECB|nr:uncharacterized protein LOC121585630 [Coregonus clupeaformis]
MKVARIVGKGKREMDFSFCRTTWKRLRGNYTREHNKKTKSGNSSVGLKDPEILQKLDWLSPFIKHKTQPTHIPGVKVLLVRGQGETGGSGEASMDRFLGRFTPLSTPAADSTFTPPVTTHTRPSRPMSTLTQSRDGPSSSKPSSSSTSGPAQPRKRTQDRVDQAHSKNPKVLLVRGQGETGGSGEASMDRFLGRFTPLSTPAADSTFTPSVTTHTRTSRPMSTLTQSRDGPSSSKPSSSSTSGPAQPRKRTQDRVDQAASKNPKDNDPTHRQAV